MVIAPDGRPRHFGRRFWRFGIAAAIVSAGSNALAAPATTSPEQGYDLGEIESPRALGMGGALNAVGVSTTALYLNPANLPVARVYHLEALGAFSPESHRASAGAAAVDSVLNSAHLAGGVAGSWSLLDPDGIHRSWTDLRAGLGYPLGDHLTLGVTGRYLRIDQGLASGPFGSSLASDGTGGKPLVNELTFDAGATVLFTQQLRLGIVGHNLTMPGTSFAPTTVAAGFGYTSQVFTVEGDALADFTTWSSTKMRLMAGIEGFLADHYAVRAGYRFDAGMNTHAASVGLGYVEKTWGIEVSVRRDLAGDNPATMLSGALRYFYDAVGGAGNPTDQPDAF